MKNNKEKYTNHGKINDGKYMKKNKEKIYKSRKNKRSNVYEEK